MSQQNIPARTFGADRIIAADPVDIWAVLTDPQALTSGGFGIRKLDGEIRAGGKLALVSDVTPDRTFRLKVADWDPPRRMVWVGGMPLGLFTGRREFTLAPVEGGTQVSIRERFFGPLAGPITRAVPDLQPSFDQFADALVQRFARETTA